MKQLRMMLSRRSQTSEPDRDEALKGALKDHRKTLDRVDRLVAEGMRDAEEIATRRPVNRE